MNPSRTPKQPQRDTVPAHKPTPLFVKEKKSISGFLGDSVLVGGGPTRLVKNPLFIRGLGFRGRFEHDF